MLARDFFDFLGFAKILNFVRLPQVIPTKRC
jgi:hypothetical protein